jgi:uncharacterized repeat protein (TIGR01451 family)
MRKGVKMKMNRILTKKFRDWFCRALLTISVLLTIFSVSAFAQVLVGHNISISAAKEFENGPAVAANPANGEFLALWHKSQYSDVQILGARIAADGTLIGESFLVTTAGLCLGGSSPAVVFNSQMNEFFVVYERTYAGSINRGIFGQRIAQDGSLIGEEISIFQAPSQENPVIAYNSISNQYLVAWKNYYNMVSGRIIDHEGMPLSPPFDLSTGLTGPGDPAVAFNPISNQYLVVFDALTDIIGQFVNSDSTLAGPFFFITTADEVQAFTSVTLNTLTNQYFVVWNDDRNIGASGGNTFGQLINADGSFSEDDILIGTFSSPPKIIFIPPTNQYFGVWVESDSGTPGTHHVFGQLLASDLTPIGSAFQVSEAGWAEPFLDLALNPSTGTVLIIWPDFQKSPNDDILGELIDISTQLADISISETAIPNPVTAGSNLTYTITVVNNGPDYAIDVILSDTLPLGASFVSASSSQGTCTQASDTVTCEIGGVAKGATVTVSIIVTAPNIEGTITNAASVSSISNDPDNTNNNGNTTVNIIPPFIPPLPPITLQSPSNGSIFDSGSLITTYQPPFNWTPNESLARFTILFSISPTDFSTQGILIARANIQGTRNSWTPVIGLWKRIMTLSFNKGDIRCVYWKVIGTRPDRTTVESEVRSLSIAKPQPVTINSPQNGTLPTGVPPTIDFNLNGNVRFRLEFSPFNDFRNPKKIKAFVYTSSDPNVVTSFNRTLTLNQWIAVMKLVRGTGYFRIKAWDGINRVTISETRSFDHPHRWIIKVNYYRNANVSPLKAGWVKVDYKVADPTSISLSGRAFISPTWWHCCSGSAEDTGVTVTWRNRTTGAEGEAFHTVKYGWLFWLYDHQWSTSVPLDGTRDNLITITAADPTGNWGKAVILVKWSL